MRNVMILLCICLTVPCAWALDANTPAPEIDEVRLVGHIEGSQLVLELACEAVTRQANAQAVLLKGDAVLDAMDNLPEGVAFDPENGQYVMSWPRSGRHTVSARFKVQSVAHAETGRREARVDIIPARVRQIELVLDRPDLDVTLPNALRVERHEDQGQVTIRAILGPHEPFRVQWQAQVALDRAKLVSACQVNTIVSVRSGLLHLDTWFAYQVAQGQLETLQFTVPQNLRITALEGDAIRTWSLTDGELSVVLSRAQTQSYGLHVLAEAGTGALPAEVNMPAITPVGGIRTSGHLAVGTSSALQLIVQEASGLTQIDGAAFARIHSDTRPVPQGKAFFYTHAGPQYGLRVAIDDIVPSFDVSTRLVTTVKEDDWLVEAQFELDVRDAPLTSLTFEVPGRLMVASVQGAQVEDYQRDDSDSADTKTLTVTFAQPVIGRVLLGMRLELGQGPLGQSLVLDAIAVKGAKTHRGYVVVAVDEGIDLAEPVAENLRSVHTASVPMRVAQAQFAYRFREPDWHMTLSAEQKPAQLRAQVFHLQSIGEALAYGSAVINGVITGSPMDEFRFALPDSLDNIEFVGSDVRRFEQQDDVWVVKLTRKVLGQYNLAVTYTQPYGPNEPIEIGILQCLDAQSQTGTVVVTSFLDLRLQLTDTQGLAPLALDELPSHIRMLCHGPILSAYRYMDDPHRANLVIDPYERGTLLPVVVDMASIESKLVVRPDHCMESVTKVQYKIKNTTGQFLSLAMPKDATVWSVSRISRQGQVTRLAVSHDQASGRLLIPLDRQVNPNDPMTIEVQYGRVHDSSGSTQLALAAPASDVPVTYAAWQVSVPRDWALKQIQGNMRLEGNSYMDVSLTSLCERLMRKWSRGFEQALRRPVIWGLAGVFALLSVVGLCARKTWARRVMILTMLAVLIWLGIEAGMKGPNQAPESVTTFNFVQAVHVDPDQALTIQADLVPAWSQYLSGLSLGASVLIVILAVVLAVKCKRMRGAAVVLVLVVCVHEAARIANAWPVLIALLTWGIPVLLGLWAVARAWCRRRALISACALAATLLSGCAGTIIPPADTLYTPIERLELDVRADKDVTVTWHMRVRTRAPWQTTLLPDKAVLVHAGDWVVDVDQGAHVLKIDKPGVHDVSLEFLMPLPAADRNQSRELMLWPLPVALTNQVFFKVNDPNAEILVPQAVAVDQVDVNDGVAVEAMFVPGAAARITWQPRQRSVSEETVRFFAQDSAVAVLLPGLVRVHHQVSLQIAQGQVHALSFGMAPGYTVTQVQGEGIGAWRYDPVTEDLEVRLLRPMTGQYHLNVVTQSANASVPYDVTWQPLDVKQAQTQHSFLALAPSDQVQVRVETQTPGMNTTDFLRDHAVFMRTAGVSGNQVTQAFRFGQDRSAVRAFVSAVQSELRSEEVARFNVEDERLVYNSQWKIEITKAGRFDVVLHMPDGFDIDTLTAPEVSHWDEFQEAGVRKVRIHFRGQTQGTVTLNLTLSRPLTAMPDSLDVPRVTLLDSLKHQGQLLVSGEQGVRLSVSQRQGVSEINPRELGYEAAEALAFRLLRPDWTLSFKTEQIQPRITVESLHHVKVTDGLVHHQHFLRYQLLHAGVKTFALTVPQDAMGVTLSGPGIARREQIDPNTWRVELAQKVYDKPYLLTLRYDTPYTRDASDIQVAPVLCREVDLQQGYVVVFAGDRVALSAITQNPSLRPADPRTIPGVFGAGDLSNAAMCYRSLAPDQTLDIRATRHDAAGQIGAQVHRTRITSVLTETGQGIHQVQVDLSVSTRRHLRVLLPDGAQIWSLAVDGQAEQPSIQTDAQSRKVLLVSLPQQGLDNVTVSLVYITQKKSGSWIGTHDFAGPQFDLPLENIQWTLYVPQAYTYKPVGGTLILDTMTSQGYSYSVDAYEQQVLQAEMAHEALAQEQQTLARQFASQGRQSAARRALSKGYNYSMGNRALNEDIRVDLNNLLQQQVKVGLVNARDALDGQQNGGVYKPDNQVSFNTQQAQQIEGTLARQDNANLDLITQRIIQAQQAAQGAASQLQVTLPTVGRLLRFNSPLLVKPMADMSVALDVAPTASTRTDTSWLYACVMFVGVLAAGFVLTNLANWSLAPTKTEPKPEPVVAMPKPEPDDDNTVSSDELI